MFNPSYSLTTSEHFDFISKMFNEELDFTGYLNAFGEWLKSTYPEVIDFAIVTDLGPEAPVLVITTDRNVFYSILDNDDIIYTFTTDISIFS